MIRKLICIVMGHTWLIAKRKTPNGYGFYQYTCSCCGKVKEEL